MRRVMLGIVGATLLAGGAARAQQPDEATIRYQIARHLVQARFDGFFPYRDGWRDARKIAPKIQLEPAKPGGKQNGAARQEVRWRVANGPGLGGVATLWRYGAKDRPAYYPATDVGDVKILGVGQGIRGASSSLRLRQRKGESKASLARRSVRAHLQRSGFAPLLAGRDLSDSGIKVRARGNTVLWKAGLKVGGDGREHYALGGRVKLTGGKPRVEVNVGSVRGWRVAGPRNGAGRRSYFPSGHRMPREPAYGHKGR